jgi:predicted peptidase
MSMVRHIFYCSFNKLLFFTIVIFIIEGCGQIKNLTKHPALPQIPLKGQNKYSKADINYLFYVPESYGKDRNKKWPLILFLHGMGERGNDLELIKKHPLPKILDEQKNFPCIAVSPQLPLNKQLWDDYIDPLKELLDQIKSKYSIDTQRVYLTGLSMGGAGTWNFALRYPKYFAAIVPIAGAYKFRSKEIPDDICKIKNLPIWTFHGGRDQVVGSWQTEILVNALKECGSNIRYTLYPEADHPQSWIKTYADPELYKWLFDQILR